jgi:hypothetical protein
LDLASLMGSLGSVETIPRFDTSGGSVACDRLLGDNSSQASPPGTFGRLVLSIQ